MNKFFNPMPNISTQIFALVIRQVRERQISFVIQGYRYPMDSFSQFHSHHRYVPAGLLFGFSHLHKMTRPGSRGDRAYTGAHGKSGGFTDSWLIFLWQESSQAHAASSPNYAIGLRQIQLFIPLGNPAASKPQGAR